MEASAGRPGQTKTIEARRENGDCPEWLPQGQECRHPWGEREGSARGGFSQEIGVHIMLCIGDGQSWRLRQTAFWWQVGAILLSAVLLISIGGLWWGAFMRDPHHNHIGCDLRLGGWALVGIAGGYCACGLRQMPRRVGWSLVLLLLAFVLAVMLFLCDHFNLLVEYEVWIRRGMPGRWER